MQTQRQSERKYYLVHELARALEEEPCTIYRLMRLGLIQHLHIRRKIKIPKEEYDRILREGIPSSR